LHGEQQASNKDARLNGDPAGRRIKTRRLRRPGVAWFVKGFCMLKSVPVLLSLVFCAGALFAPPSARGAAEWSGAVLRSAGSWAQSALSVVLASMPSSGDVARYVERTRLLAEDLASHALGNAHEPERRAAAEPPSWCDPRVQAVLQQVEDERVRSGASAPTINGAVRQASLPECQ
jgi:hypothetical protein